MPPRFICLGCREPVESLWATLVHCDPYEPIDDIEDDEPTIIRGDD